MTRRFISATASGGSVGDKSFDRRLWFSDVFLLTPEGWRYFFGQVSLPLPGTADLN